LVLVFLGAGVVAVVLAVVSGAIVLVLDAVVVESTTDVEAAVVSAA
jgi:hypothetical protein